MNPEGTDPLQTSLRQRDEAENEPLENSDNDHSGKNYLYWRGVVGKNLVTGGGSYNFLMILQKIPPAPPYLAKNERSLTPASNQTRLWTVTQ